MSTNWPYQQITDHEQQALDRLTSQYDDATKLQELIKNFTEQVQILEDTEWQLLTERWVPNAVGNQLDRMGKIVGEPRAGRNDTDYRSAILSRALINRLAGEIEPLIQYGLTLSNGTNAIYIEFYPASIYLFLQGEIVRQEYKQMQRVRPAGVGPLFVAISGGPLPFGYKEILPEDFLLDNGDLLELSDGDTLAIVDQQSGNVAPDPNDRLYYGDLSTTTVKALELSTNNLLELSTGNVLGVKSTGTAPMPSDGGVYAGVFTPTLIVPENLELSDNSLFELDNNDNLELNVRIE